MLDEREDSTFGTLLRSFRIKRGLNQLGLARKLGMQTRDTISAWERHRYLPDKRDKVMQIANALGLNDQQRNQLLFAAGYALEPQKEPEVQAPATRVEYMVVEHLEIPPTIPVSSEARRYDCYQHIALPVNYVARRDLLETVIALLSSRAALMALTSAVKGKPTALHGMGGIGKSVIARALCDEQAVRQAFPDGILWATLGQTPNLPELLRSWIEVLGGRISESAPTVESLKRLLAGLLKNRTCLLILDDVWQHTHANAFRVDAPGCCLFLTTRDAEIAREMGAQIQPIPVMTSKDAIKLLEEWADGQLTGANAALKEQIVKRLGYLPLAVKLAGAQLQWKAPEDWLSTFDVNKLESLRPEDLHGSLAKTFLLSLDELDKSPLHEQARQLYLALAIFKEDEAMSLTAIAKLWQEQAGVDVSTTDMLLHDLASRALLDLVAQGISRAAHMHDLMRDLISKELGENGHLAAHKALLSAYRATCTGNGWHTAPDDGYLYDHLAYHQAAAGAWEELKGLFANQHWMEVRIPQNDYTYEGYLADLSLALEHAFANTRQQIEANQEPDGIIECMRYTLIRTSINSLAGSFVPKLVTRAIEEELWAPARAMGIAAKIPDSERRARMYTELLKTGRLDPKQQEQAHRFALDTALLLAHSIWDSPSETRKRAEGLIYLADLLPPKQRSQVFLQTLEEALALPKNPYGTREWVLAALAPRLPPEQRTQALQQILETVFNDPLGFMVPILAYLAPVLTGPLLQQALEAALALPESEEQTRVLAALAPQLPPEQRAQVLQQALEAALALSKDQSRKQAWVLAALAPQLPPEQRTQVLQQALEAALTLSEPEEQAWVLANLAPQLPPEQRAQVLQQAFEAVVTLPEPEAQARILQALAPQLTGPLLQQALEVALALSEGEKGWRTEVLEALAPQLTGPLLQQALERALALPGQKEQAHVLADLAPQLLPEQRTQVLQQALEVALAVLPENVLGANFAYLVPQLTGPLLQQALERALALPGQKEQAHVLADLAPQLTGPLLQQALEAALTLPKQGKQPRMSKLWTPQQRPKFQLPLPPDHWGEQAHVLAALAPQLTGPLLQRALEAALALPDDSWEGRAGVLKALAPQLTGPLLQKAFEAVLTLPEQRGRVGVLKALAPQLTGPLLQQALEAALTLSDHWEQAEMLEALAPQLTAALLQQALKAVLALPKCEGQARVLVVLIPQLPPEQRAQVLQQELEAVLTLPKHREQVQVPKSPIPQQSPKFVLAIPMPKDLWGEQARTLAILVPQLTGPLLQQAFEAALALPEQEGRADILAALAPQLPIEQRAQALQQAFEAALTLPNESYRGARAHALMALAPQLTGPLLQQALEAALTLSDDQWGTRGRVLAALAPQLTGPLLQQALETVLNLPKDRWGMLDDQWGTRGRVLAALAPQLNGPLLQQALETVLTLPDDHWIEKANMLAALAPQLTGPLLQQALETVLNLPKDRWRERTQMLRTLAPQLTSVSLQQTLETISLMKDEYSRATVYATIVPFMPDQALLLKPIRQAVLNALASFQQESCRELLGSYLYWELFTPSFLSPETLGAIALYIIEICQQWRWL